MGLNELEGLEALRRNGLSLFTLPFFALHTGCQLDPKGFRAIRYKQKYEIWISLYRSKNVSQELCITIWFLMAFNGIPPFSAERRLLDMSGGSSANQILTLHWH